MKRTAYMPTVRDARASCKKRNLDGVLIIGFADGNIGAASYGSTKAQCAQLGKLLDHVVEQVERGEVNLSTFEARE